MMGRSVLLAAALLACSPTVTKEVPKPARTVAPPPPLPAPRRDAGRPAPPDAGLRHASWSGRAAPSYFSASVLPIDAGLRAQMLSAGSWKPGCPVPLEDLRLLRVVHHDGKASAWGEMVVHEAVTEELEAIFGELHAAGFPIAKMRLIEAYDASDDRSVADNNTSAFNCRPITGGKRFSRHSYGRAIDINPLVNPYWSKKKDEVIPPSGRPFLNRSKKAPGMISAKGPVVRAFAKRGWKWGGAWRSVKDWQHFEKRD